MWTDQCKTHHFLRMHKFFFFYTRKHFGIWQIWQLPITFNIYICLIPHSQYSPKLRLFFFLHLSLVEIIWFGWFSSGNWIIKIHAYSLNLILANSFCHSSSSSEHKKKKKYAGLNASSFYISHLPNGGELMSQKAHSQYNRKRMGI